MVPKRSSTAPADPVIIVCGHGQQRSKLGCPQEQPFWSGVMALAARAACCSRLVSSSGAQVTERHGSPLIIAPADASVLAPARPPSTVLLPTSAATGQDSVEAISPHRHALSCVNLGLFESGLDLPLDSFRVTAHLAVTTLVCNSQRSECHADRSNTHSH